MIFDLNVQLRHVFSVVSGATPDSNNQEYWDGDILWITPEELGNRNSYYIADTRRKITRAGYKYSGVTVVPSHSIVLSKRAPIGHLALLQSPAGSNQGCFLLTPKCEMDSRYFYYYLSSKVGYLQALGSGSTFTELRSNDLKSIQIPKPPLHQQRAVADYLDRETALLDALVAAKEYLLKLLIEKRQALITYAVTGGIGPSALPRTRGMSWPRGIPAYWRIGRLKDFGSLLAGVGFPHEFQGVDGESLPFYKVGDLATSIDDRFMAQPSNTISFETAMKLRARVVPKGAIVYAKIGAALLLNRRRITTVPCVIDNNMTAYIPCKEILTSEWTFYWTSTLDFGIFANPGAVPSLSEGDQAQLPIALPPVDEQLAIIDYLDRETGLLDKLVTRTRETIALLKERRSALIAAAVTGEIDVESTA